MNKKEQNEEEKTRQKIRYAQEALKTTTKMKMEKIYFQEKPIYLITYPKIPSVLRWSSKDIYYTLNHQIYEKINELWPENTHNYAIQSANKLEEFLKKGSNSILSTSRLEKAINETNNHRIIQLVDNINGLFIYKTELLKKCKEELFENPFKTFEGGLCLI